jgi:hypothetical protein
MKENRVTPNLKYPFKGIRECMFFVTGIGSHLLYKFFKMKVANCFQMTFYQLSH